MADVLTATAAVFSIGIMPIAHVSKNWHVGHNFMTDHVAVVPNRDTVFKNSTGYVCCLFMRSLLAGLAMKLLLIG
jgi:hypothetical protein